MASKVVVIGIDGGTFDLIRPWAEQGVMPVMASLIKEGVSGDLETTRPPVTCPAWWCFSTSKNPGHFGSYHFWGLMPKSYEVRQSRFFGPGKNMELWDILNNAGLRCGIVNNPIMFPPAKVDGYSVSGWFGTTKSDYTYPPDLRDELDEVTGGYEIDFDIGECKTDEDLLTNCLNSLEKRRKTICHLLSAEDRPEFFLGVITSSDKMCHRLVNKIQHGNEEAEQAEKLLLSFFQSMDDAIGEIVATLDESDHLIIMSDHGFGKRERGFYLNEWLRKNGYLALKAKGVRGRILNYSRRKARRAILRMGLGDIVRKRVPRSLLTRFAPIGETEGEGVTVFDYIQNGLVDWGNTRAIALPDGLIYINTKDRPDGIVEFGEEYESLRDELVERLSNLKDPSNGKKLETEVLKSEEMYKGDCLSEAPDVYLAIENYSVAAFSNIKNSNDLMGPLELASHMLNGMLVVKGPGIKKNARIESAKLLDLTPTILHMMGVAIPDDMEGIVLRDLFESDSELASRETVFQKAKFREKWTSPESKKEEDEEIRKRLEELGYI